MPYMTRYELSLNTHLLITWHVLSTVTDIEGAVTLKAVKNIFAQKVYIPVGELIINACHVSNKCCEE